MVCHIGFIIYSILQFIAFLFILVGTPIDMFRAHEKSVWGNTQCLTMWGFKMKCYSNTYDIKPSELFPACTERRDRFRAAEAFAIISIVVYGVACIFGFVQLCCCSCLRWACVLLNIFGITSCISWAIMSDLYLKDTTSSPTWTTSVNCHKLKLNYKHGAGFALLITGWALNLVGIVFLAFPC
ncbi:amastin-like protein [Lotmaria passim]